MRRRSWTARAACVGVPLEVFFPEVGVKHGQVVGDTEPALRYCMACPVRLECRAYATKRKLEGVWGGMIFLSDVDGQRRARSLRAVAAR